MRTSFQRLFASSCAQCRRSDRNAHSTGSGGVRINLPSQSLAASLQAIGRLTAMNILFEPESVANQTAPPVRGRYSVEEAIRHVLAGKQLAAQQTAPNTVLVQPANGGSTHSTGGIGPYSSQAVPESARAPEARIDGSCWRRPGRPRAPSRPGRAQRVRRRKSRCGKRSPPSSDSRRGDRFGRARRADIAELRRHGRRSRRSPSSTRSARLTARLAGA